MSEANLSYIKTDNPLIVFQSNRDFAYCYNGIIKIGCESKTIAEWLEYYEAVGKENRYSDQEIKLYGDYIKSCAEIYKE